MIEETGIIEVKKAPIQLTISQDYLDVIKKALEDYITEDLAEMDDYEYKKAAKILKELKK